METQVKEFNQLVKKSNRVLITSHLVPDPDAVCSGLLLANTLKANYPAKKVFVCLEEEPENLEFLTTIDEIKFGPLLAHVKSFEPDLLVITDANNFDRCSRLDGPDIRMHIQKNNIKTAIIDHHEPGDHDKVDLYIREHSPATTQTIFNLLFMKLKLKKPAGYAETALLGIISDTSRFLYENPAHRQTFAIVSDLLDDGSSIETLTHKQSRYAKKHMKVLGELANNTVVEKDYTYSFISDKFKSAWMNKKHTAQELKEGVEIYVNNYLRNVDGRTWGFIVYPDLIDQKDTYGVSFRSVTGARDVSEIARVLGGGGHKPAAGVKVKAKSIDEVIKEVKAVISKIAPAS